VVHDGERRPTGALERDVLLVLWAAAAPRTPGQVRDALGQDLAYTTVMTVLTRLWQKGMVSRHRSGRGYAYEAVMSRPDFSADQMHAALDQAGDRAATLARFVNTLSKRETRMLRRILDIRPD
jgi:predicted transcriptional regulator